jgi:hypothetical protein
VKWAHFYQAYRAELNRMMEIEGELPAVRKYIEERSRDGRRSPVLRSGDTLTGTRATRSIRQEMEKLTGTTPGPKIDPKGLRDL